MNLRSTMAAALQRYLADPKRPSARVLPATFLAVEITCVDGARVTHTFDPQRAVVELTPTQVLVWRDGLARSEAAGSTRGQPHDVWSFTSDKTDLERLYRDILKALRGPVRASRLKPVLVGAAVALAVLVVGGPKAPSAPVPDAVAAAPGQLPSPPIAVAPPATPPQASLKPEESRMVTGLKGVKLAGSGPIYYVFSDPNCPFCKELEKAVAVVSGYQPVILPLGYKSGSRDLAAAVMCSAEPGKEWARAIAGTSSAKPCDKGYQLVDANMQVFEKLGLSSTPTMVTPKGTLVTGAATPEELRAVLQR